MQKEFVLHLLNQEGKEKALQIAIAFDELLLTIRNYCPEGRELSLVRTKLEEACFFAKKAMAGVVENQASVNQMD